MAKQHRLKGRGRGGGREKGGLRFSKEMAVQYKLVQLQQSMRRLPGLTQKPCPDFRPAYKKYKTLCNLMHILSKTLGLACESTCSISETRASKV